MSRFLSPKQQSRARLPRSQAHSNHAWLGALVVIVFLFVLVSVIVSFARASS